MQKCKDPLEREFYIKMTKRFGWTKDVLINNIENQAFANAMVTAHGDVAEHRYLIIRTARLLPCLDQWTVVEINVQFIIRAFQYIHLKHQLSRFGEQCLFQSFRI